MTNVSKMFNDPRFKEFLEKNANVMEDFEQFLKDEKAQEEERKAKAAAKREKHMETMRKMYHELKERGLSNDEFMCLNAAVTVAMMDKMGIVPVEEDKLDSKLVDAEATIERAIQDCVRQDMDLSIMKLLSKVFE